MKTKDLIFVVVLSLVLPIVILLCAPDRNIVQADIEQQETQDSSVESYSVIEIPVLHSDGTVMKMDLEDYVLGVTLSEMPAEFEYEALKAQSVAARTYALKKYESRNKHSDSAICVDSNCCQGYVSKTYFLNNGGTEQQYEKIAKAVAETSGQILIYAGELIDATYFSCSGGRTEDALAVWGSDVPYLRSVDSPGEEAAKHFTDTKSISVDDFQSILGVKLTGKPEIWFKSVSYTSGGGIASMIIGDKSFDGTELRRMLELRSTSFTLSVTGNDIIISTKGFGHRVGMSQYGADALALSGKNYKEILAHYYHNTELITYMP